MKTIGIIGGKGLMGSFFASFFRKLGLRVIVSDRHTKLNNAGLVKKSDIVFFSVPIHLTQKVIEQALPFTRPNQLLLDCTSLKIMPMRAMMKSSCEVIGLHPMFRPSPMGWKNQIVVMCEGRAEKKTTQMVRGWFEQAGARVEAMTARKHDRLMSIIQALLHFHTIVLGHTMHRLGIPLRETLKAASPIYKLEMDMIGRIFSQDAVLYGSIIMENPESARVTRALLLETQKMAEIIERKKRNQFGKIFRQTSLFLGDFKDEALEEINKLLTHVR